MTKLKITKYFRWKVIEKWLAGNSHRKIAKHLCISKGSVSNIINHFQRFGCIKPLPSLCGRPRLLSSNDTEYLEFLLKERIDWYIWEIQNEMESWLGYSISYSTIWRAIHHLGYTHKQV